MKFIMDIKEEVFFGQNSRCFNSQCSGLHGRVNPYPLMFALIKHAIALNNGKPLPLIYILDTLMKTSKLEDSKIIKILSEIKNYGVIDFDGNMVSLTPNGFITDIMQLKIEEADAVEEASKKFQPQVTLDIDGSKREIERVAKSAVAVFIRGKGGKILFGKRKNPLRGYGDNQWQLAGGKLGHLEDWIACCKREAKEEAGVDIDNVKFLTARNYPRPEIDTHYVCLFFMADHVGGEPTVMEPDKCSEWKWFDPSNTPEPTFMDLAEVIREKKMELYTGIYAMLAGF